mgnify:CR=1 FL=1
MPTKTAREKARDYIQQHLPRLLAVMWALWNMATAAAYVDRVPPQLEVVDKATSVPLWTIWALATIALALGVLAPSTAPDKVQDVARWLRIGGMMIACAALIVWTVAFFYDEPRGWVTGKNYALLAAMAAFTTWTIARDNARRERVVAV